ncbi:farnesoic acid carboxyl-O-methyltransferase-like isoform X2 [Nymphaea colorata]|nr:farnesoic acid carboxyl-O-methyltransferase-like isoform X2 [Nymphaea colorata]
MVEEAIHQRLDIPSETATIRIADLGCSVGPNTFHSVQTVAEAMKTKLRSSPSLQGKPFQLQVFFNDQVGNDFNTLFQTLPPNWPYFVAAVPGSFYSQLFPQDSIHYFNSSFALHWLSKVPDGCCNKGRLHCHGGDRDIVSAYQAQFRADMAAFLAARAGELVAGGLLVLQFVCRHEWMPADAPRYDMWFAYIESILRELVAEGKVKEDDLDSFQLPIYSPTIEEFKEIVGNISSFSVPVAQIVDLHHGDDDGKTHEICESDRCERARDVGLAARAVFGDMVGNKFGRDTADELFRRFPEAAYEYFVTHPNTPSLPPTAFVVLKKED